MAGSEKLVTPGFGQRIWIYLAEMFPLHINVPISFFGFFGYYFLLQILVGHTPLAITPHSLIGAVSLSGFALLMRVFDEFKDLETDKKLFPHRPVPSGRVYIKDIKILGIALVALMVLLNLRPGYSFWGFALLLTYGFLTFKYFFLRELHLRSLPLNLATHNPVTVVSHFYVLTVLMDDFHLSLGSIPVGAWIAIPMFWMVVFCWETSRKIRTPEMEDDYVTYSKLFGPRGAALIPMAGLLLSFSLVEWFAFTLGWSLVSKAALALAFAISIGGFIRWLIKQTPKNSKLRPFVETYSLILYLTLMIEFGCKYGYCWFR